MNISDAKKVKVPRQRSFRVGRGTGTGLGKTSGKGHKGAKSRAGYSRLPYFQGGTMPLIRRIPKRGFNNKRFRKPLDEVNIASLERFETGAVVDVETLRKAGLLRRALYGVKVLGEGELSKSLTVRAQAFSAAARAKIEAAGGKAEVVDMARPEPAAENAEA